MPDIVIELTERVKADYQDLPGHVKKKFKKQLRFLAANPRIPRCGSILFGGVVGIGNSILTTNIGVCSDERATCTTW